jgi:hypothetical protein
VGKYVVEAQIDFLLQQTLHDLEESRKDKVTKKAGTRGVVNWTETTTAGRQIAKVGLINTALRLAQAKAKLAGVDITGRAQREMALAEERQRREAMARGQEAEVGVQRSEVRRDEEAKAKKPLIKKNEKSAVAAEIVQPQAQAGKEDESPFGTEEYIKNEVCKQLIKDLRDDPGCAGWTDSQRQEYAQRLWDSRPQRLQEEIRRRETERREKDAAAEPLASSRSADPHPGPLPKGEGEDCSPLAETPRRRRDKPRSPQERRREFLAPLAAG